MWLFSGRKEIQPFPTKSVKWEKETKIRRKKGCGATTYYYEGNWSMEYIWPFSGKNTTIYNIIWQK